MGVKQLNGTVNVTEFISFESFMVINLKWFISGEELSWIDEFETFQQTGIER